MKKSLLLLIFILVSCTNQPGENLPEPSIPPEVVISTETIDSEDDSIESDPETITPTIIPNQAKISWSSIGPGGGGFMPAMAFISPNTLYIGCDVGGVYRSYDGGESYKIINNGLNNYNALVITIHPDNPNTIYLGTGGGIYKSTDGGDLWISLRNGFPPLERFKWSAPITSIAVDPINTDTVYAGIGDSNSHSAGEGTIYKSVDAGENWYIVNSGDTTIHQEAIIYSILIHPENPSILYTSTDYGVLKSEDGGEQWEEINTGLPHTNTRKLMMDPTDPAILYLTIHSPPGIFPWQGGVYKSIDGGESWKPKNVGLGKHVGEPGDHYRITANYENLLINPQDPNILYVGAVSWWNAGIYKSMDGGESWRNVLRIENTEPGWLNYFDWSPGQGESMAIDPANPDRVFYADAWQAFATQNGGVTWQQMYSNETPVGSGWWKGRGLETTVVYDIEVDPSNSNLVYIGYWDIGIHKTEDEGVTFLRLMKNLEYPENIFDIEIDPNHPNLIYASSGGSEWNSGNVVFSEDFGQSWKVIGNPTSGLPDAQVYDLVLGETNPTDQRTLYAASYQNGVYKSIDGGMSWVEMNAGLGKNGNLLVSSLVIDPTDSNILFAGLDMNGLGQGFIQSDQLGGIYKTLDGGTSWSNLDAGIPNVLDISVNPHNPQVVYAAARSFYEPVNEQSYQGGVFKSVDGGENWSLVFEDPFVEVVVVDPHTPDIVYAGTSDHPYHDHSTGNGLFRSDDSGQSWYAVNERLTQLTIRDLAFDPTNPAILYLGTAGNGVFKGSVQE